MLYSRNERRSDDRDSAFLSLRQWLRSVSERYPLRLLAVVEEDGIVIDCIGDEKTAEQIAAWAPMLARTRDPVVRERLLESASSYVPGIRPSQLAVRRVRIGEDDVYLCVVATDAVEAELAAAGAVEGVARILH